MINYICEIDDKDIFIKETDEKEDILIDRDIDFCDIDNYIIFAEIYRCIFNNKEEDIPLIRVSIIYNRKILVGSLFDYYLMFDQNNKQFYFILKGDIELENKVIININNIDDAIKKITELKSNKEFIDLIKKGLELRDLKRQNNSDIFNYNINKKIINLNKVRECGFI